MARVTEQNPDPTTRLLKTPVVIVLETVAELNWAYDTFSRSIHHKDVRDSSPEQNFNAKIYTELNQYCAEYRRKL